MKGNVSSIGKEKGESSRGPGVSMGGGEHPSRRECLRAFGKKRVERRNRL